MTIKNWRTIGALLCAFGAIGASARAQTLQNGGFEGAYIAATGSKTATVAGDVAPGWTDNTSWAEGIDLSYSRETTNAHGGAACQKIMVHSGFAQFAQFLTFEEKYQTFGVWLRAQSPMWVNLTLREAGSPYTVYANRAVHLTDTWTRFEVAAQTPAVEGILIVKTAGIGTLWADDATLAQSDTAPPITLHPPTQTRIPATYFGMNANHMHDQPGYAWPAIEFGAFRNWDSGVVWSSIETARGVYDWANLDGDVAKARARGQKYLFNFGGTPRWAAPGGTPTYIGTNAPPDNMADLRDFARAIATRYRGKIEAYEVWNEPDIPLFYSGTGAQLLQMERAVLEGVRAGDPKALVAAPALAGVESAQAFPVVADYFAAGGGKGCDLFIYHSYDPPETAPDATQTLRDALASYHLPAKPIWLTERGAQLGTLTPTDAANFVARSFILGWATGVARQYWYAYDNEGYWSLDKQNHAAKTSDPTQLDADGIAYREVRRWLFGAQMLSCGSDGRFWTCALRQSNGRVVHIVWTTGKVSDFAIPANWKARAQRDLSGAQKPITRATIAVGAGPVLLVGG